MKTVFPNVRILGIVSLTFIAVTFLILSQSGSSNSIESGSNSSNGRRPEGLVARDLRVRAKLTENRSNVNAVGAEKPKLPEENIDFDEARKLPDVYAPEDKSEPRNEINEGLKEIQSRFPPINF